MKPAFKVILFDLGNVLIELDGPPIKPEWLLQPVPESEIWRRWGQSRCVKALETGAIGADDFITGIVQEQGIALAAEDYRQAFSQWPKAFYSGAVAMLEHLRTRYKLAFYSNTSVLHLPRLQQALEFHQFFDHGFASYQIGFFKPDPAGYEHVIKQLHVAAEQILFIDDTLANVDGALAMGLRARHAKGIQAVEAVLKSEGCW